MIYFFNDTATTEIYTLSLHDALPIFEVAVFEAEQLIDTPVAVDLERRRLGGVENRETCRLDLYLTGWQVGVLVALDRKSTRLNSSHANISYAVFCLKKKKM